MNSGRRRVRVTLRCYQEDLGLPLPGIAVELVPDHALVDEAARHSDTAPKGLKRIACVHSPPVFRLRYSRYRGAVWVDKANDILWLLAVGIRKAGSEDDAFELVERLHESGRLMPTKDDRFRDEMESASRLLGALPEEVARVVAKARANPSSTIATRMAGNIAVRVCVEPGDDLEVIWVAVACLDVRKAPVRPEIRDMIFTHFERELEPAEWEDTGSWPGGRLKFYECCRYALRAN